jgi:hypothetical protein
MLFRVLTWSYSLIIMGILPSNTCIYEAQPNRNRDHFDQKVEASLRRDLPIITTPHAHSHLTNKGADSFTNVSALDPFETATVDIKDSAGPRRQLRITGMPGKHVPSNSIAESLNSLANAVHPPPPPRHPSQN